MEEETEMEVKRKSRHNNRDARCQPCGVAGLCHRSLRTVATPRGQGKWSLQWSISGFMKDFEKEKVIYS